MMKHGLIALALACWLAGTVSAEYSPGIRIALTSQELESVDGGDLILSVNRDKQMMTVTRITPGNYDNIQCYSIRVTTSVVRNKDVTPNNPKNSMENTVRDLKHQDYASVPAGETRTPTQFPSGTAKLSPESVKLPNITGPVIRTDATQTVKGTNAKGEPIQVPDSGYAIHYVDPAISTNTLGCIGVQSMEGMLKLVASADSDNKSSTAGRPTTQTVTVTPPSKPSVPAAPSSGAVLTQPIYRPYTPQAPNKPL